MKALLEELQKAQESQQECSRGLQGCEEDRLKLKEALQQAQAQVAALQAALEQANARLEEAESRAPASNAMSAPGGEPASGWLARMRCCSPRLTLEASLLVHL